MKNKNLKEAFNVKSETIFQKKFKSANKQVINQELLHKMQPDFGNSKIQDSITNDERLQVINWFFDVFKHLKIQLFDICLRKDNFKVNMQNIYLISTSLISLTLKIEGNLEVPIDELMQKICHQQLTNKEIILQEYQIIYKLDFKYIYTTVYDILLFHLQQVFIGIEEQNFNQILKLSAFALSKRIQSEEFYVNNIYVNVAGSITSAYVFHTQIQKLQKQIDKQELQNRILKSMRLKKETVKKTLKKETKICFKILQNNYNKKTEQNILKKILSLQVNLYFQN